MKKILLLLLLLSPLLKAQDSVPFGIQHFEPSSWWIGMKNPELQILVHGKDISKYKPSINKKGVKLNRVHTVENPNYLFLDITIAKSTQAGEVFVDFVNAEGKKLKEKLLLQNRVSNSAQRKGFDNSDVIYLITPDRFANGDPSNDNTQDTKEKLNRTHYNGRHGGDIQGIINNLDYIKNMGFTTLWSMPLLENNLKEVTYHGYSITDYYKIDPRYGSNELFKEMVAKSKAKGMKWIMDVIPNHCGIDHWWMADLPSKDWINNEGKFKPNSHRREVHQDLYVSEKDKKSMIEGWFVPTMPDLNQRNPFMAKYLTQNTIWWIEYAGLSGLRVDTYPYSEKKFLTDWVSDIMNEYPHLNIVGEEWTSNANTIAYWQKGVKNKDGYQTHIPSMMDFPTQMSLAQALTEEEGFHSGMAKLYLTLSNDYLYPDPNNLVIFGDNHDMNRFYTQVKEEPKLFKMGMAYLATLRGIPQIYYGTEIGMANPNSEEHGVIRADMPGGWQGDAANAFTGENLSDNQKDLQDFTKKLFNWRRTAEVIHSGKLMHFIPNDGLYSFVRYNDDQKVWVILNKADKVATLNIADYAEILPENAQLKDVMDNSIWKGTVSLPAKGFRILELKP
jgi:glycosidase